jgi:hypothetical protein
LCTIAAANGHADREQCLSFVPGSHVLDAPGREIPETLPEGTQPDWWSTIQKNIRDSEYHITWQGKTCLQDVDAAWQAPNRAHNLRTYFTPDGVRVVPRTSETPEWNWGLSLQGYGCHCKATVFPVMSGPCQQRYWRTRTTAWNISGGMV